MIDKLIMLFLNSKQLINYNDTRTGTGERLITFPVVSLDLSYVLVIIIVMMCYPRTKIDGKKY